MSYALHSVQISNNLSLDDAKKEAQKFIKDKKKKYHRETTKFYRFRNIAKQKFKPKSFKSKKINDDIVLVYGELKDENKHLSGGGFMDFLKNPIGTIKEAFRGIPSKLNNISTKTLNEYGKLPINALQIARTPLNATLNGVINIMSLGKFNELKSKYGFDKMYHLSLIATLTNNKIVIEKNEVINIEPLSQSSTIGPNTEYLNVPLSNAPNLTLIDMIDKTREYMGESKFYDYDGFNNNCQAFIASILNANNLMTPQADKFILQDVSGLQNDLNNTGFSYVPKVMRKITNLGSIVSRLIGKGTKKKALDEFDKYIKKSNINEDDLNSINEHFIDFINSEGIKFI